MLFVRALRLGAAAALAWCVAVALAAPEFPLLTRAAAAAVALVTAWRPDYALVAVAALTPAGLLLAGEPARGADLLAWAFVAVWLGAVWRPLAPAGLPRRVAWPALLYAAAAVASWTAMTLAEAAGVEPMAIGGHLARAVGTSFLVFSIPETETWTMLQVVTGTALLLAAAAVARTAPELPRRIGWAIAGSLALLAMLTAVDVARQWAAAGYEVGYLLRYTRGERFALHLTDLNAAGSQYVLAAGIAIGLAVTAGRSPTVGNRPWWSAIVLLLLMLPAFWLTGSRSAIAGVLGAAAAIAAVRRRAEWITRTQVAAGISLLALAIVLVAGVAAFGSDERGSAARALRLRTQFLQTSLRMIAAEPIDGVGVGRYFARSPEFMPPDLRDLYGAENAHNYFAQQVAELGIVGGAVFVWLIVAAGIAGWRAARATEARPGTAALFGGCAGYVLTCLTGHPFLVAAAALPFWIALGLLVALDEQAPVAASRRRLVGGVIALLLLVNVVQGVRAWRAAAAVPPERGFDRTDVANDGRPVRWTSPHVVTYIPSGAGFLRMTMRAPDRELSRPVVVETSIAGRLVDRRTLPVGDWITAEIPVRFAAGEPFRRVDVRVSPFWLEQRTLGRRTALVDVALGVMMAELRWIRATGP